MKKEMKEDKRGKVIHVDCNGEIIPDLSKVVLPVDLSREIYNIILRSRERRLESEGTQSEK